MSCIILASHFEELLALRLTRNIRGFRFYSSLESQVWDRKSADLSTNSFQKFQNPNQNKTQAGKSEFPEILLTFEV